MRDFKNYKAPECANVSRMCSILMIVGLVALLAWMGERDHQAKLEQVRLAAQCKVQS